MKQQDWIVHSKITYLIVISQAAINNDLSLIFYIDKYNESVAK